MKKIIFLSFFLFAQYLYGQRPPAFYFHLVSIADSLQRAKNFTAASATYNAAFAVFKGKGLVNDRYKAACAYARSGNIDSSFYNLFRIADKGGWSEYDFMISDSDLYVLHPDQRWNTLVNKVRKNKAEVESHLNKPLAQELGSIFEDDQKYRLLVDSAEKISEEDSPRLDSLHKIIQHHDNKNQVRVTELLDKYGWLGTDDVGRKGNQALFLVILHADPATRKKYLPLMQEGVGRSKAAPSELALLEDRVLLDEGKSQRYGSQVKFNPASGTYELYPIDDESGVNGRREAMGLAPIEDYLRQWGIHYMPKN
ncbi:hypothetical protein BH11BAC1_BH11BAC1_21780 [soil metagenome]